MRIRLLIPALVVAVAGGSASSALAQYGYYNNQPQVAAPYTQRPALSPFLNLLRGGDPAANYYMGVLPEYNNRYFQQQVRTNLMLPPLRGNETYLDDGADVELQIRRLPPTGHAAGFMIYNAYYNVPNQRGFLPYNPGIRVQTPQIPR